MIGVYVRLVLFLLFAALGGTMCLVIVMLPVYFLRKKKNPTNKKNSLKLLIIKSYIVTFIFNLICWSGLIAQYIEEMREIYR